MGRKRGAAEKERGSLRRQPAPSSRRRRRRRRYKILGCTVVSLRFSVFKIPAQRARAPRVSLDGDFKNFRRLDRENTGGKEEREKTPAY